MRVSPSASTALGSNSYISLNLMPGDGFPLIVGALFPEKLLPAPLSFDFVLGCSEPKHPKSGVYVKADGHR